MTLKRVMSQAELAKLDSFAIVVSSGYKFYIGLLQLHIEGSTSIRATSEAIACNSIEEAILKSRVMFPDKLLVDIVTLHNSLGVRYETHFNCGMSLLKDGTIAYEIE